MSQSPPKYLNRELSWLEFDQRVLDEAQDSSVPLLERLKFLAISASNLDEFFRVRVGGLRLLRDQGVTRPDPAGYSPAQQLDLIRARVRALHRDQYRCYSEQLVPPLTRHGLRQVRPEQLNKAQRTFVERLFDEQILAVLAPSAVAGVEDFPLLPNESLNVCVHLARPPEGRPGSGTVPEGRFAIIPLGQTLSRFITLPSDGGHSYLLLEDAVALLVDRFFDGAQVLDCAPFRVTRNADITLQEDDAADLTEEMEELLFARREAECVRIEVSQHAARETVAFLRHSLAVAEEDVYLHPGPLDLGSFFGMALRVGFDELKYADWPPQPSTRIAPGSTMFETIAEGDLLLIHPYESFEPVVRFLEEAAEDPDVLAIKQTLYRTSRDSAIVAALMRAAENGKHVTVIVELKARFDEARNIRWARRLEQAGAQVIYGVKGFKTHAKCCIIVRREPDGIRRYVHFGTGNYNEMTGRLYSDVSLFTRNEELGRDAVSFFNAATGASQPQNFRRIAAAPLGLRETLLGLIESEIERKRQGQRASITIKLNSLVDPQLIDVLYEASRQGIRVRLNIRGICCLRPGVPGLSENIEVVSIIDRYLEHARVLCFHHGGDPRVYLSSADWMPRNLDKRIELLVPVDDPACRDRLIAMLDIYFQDNVKARLLQPDGSQRQRPSEETAPHRAQAELHDMAYARVRDAAHRRLTEFIPHQAPAS
ncbi:MAG: polyphosphate kinase 1 [Planctomycetaceae bacterium]